VRELELARTAAKAGIGRLSIRASFLDQALKTRLSDVPGNQEPQMEMLIVGLEMLRRLLPRIGPYVLVEIVLPGGTLFALLLYLYQRWNSSISGTDIAPAPKCRRAGSPVEDDFNREASTRNDALAG
jgi:hypothetical protein